MTPAERIAYLKFKVKALIISSTVGAMLGLALGLAGEAGLPYWDVIFVAVMFAIGWKLYPHFAVVANQPWRKRKSKLDGTHEALN